MNQAAVNNVKIKAIEYPDVRQCFMYAFIAMVIISIIMAVIWLVIRLNFPNNAEKWDDRSNIRLCNLFSIVITVLVLVVTIILSIPGDTLDVAKIESGYSITSLSPTVAGNSGTTVSESLYDDTDGGKITPVTFLDKSNAPRAGYLEVNNGTAKLLMRHGNLFTEYRG